MRLGWGEWLVIGAVVLLLVGARRLPAVGRSLGEAIREFQRALRQRPGSGDKPDGDEAGHDHTQRRR